MNIKSWYYKLCLSLIQYQTTVLGLIKTIFFIKAFYTFISLFLTCIHFFYHPPQTTPQLSGIKLFLYALVYPCMWRQEIDLKHCSSEVVHLVFSRLGWMVREPLCLCFIFVRLHMCTSTPGFTCMYGDLARVFMLARQEI